MFRFRYYLEILPLISNVKQLSHMQLIIVKKNNFLVGGLFTFRCVLSQVFVSFVVSP